MIIDHDLIDDPNGVTDDNRPPSTRSRVLPWPAAVRQHTARVIGCRSVGVRGWEYEGGRDIIGWGMRAIIRK